MDYDALAALARPALITAAARRSTMTYKELGRAIGLDANLPLPHHINRVLDRVATTCVDAGEPSLAVLVVNGQTGEPGPGFNAGSAPWFTETQACFRRWAIA